MIANPSDETRAVLDQALRRLERDLHEVPNEIGRSLLTSMQRPPAITEWHETVHRILSRLDMTSRGADLPLSLDETEILRAAVGLMRRQEAEAVRGSQQMLSDADVAQALEERYAPCDRVLNLEPLSSVTPRKRPRAADYLTRQGMDTSHAPQQIPPRQYDPKHQALLSAAILMPDLRVMRDHCDQRHLSTGVVFADLDDFKRFNTELGDVKVDQRVLPQVLRVVERTTFGRAAAYRYGGDEVVVLVPNASVSSISEIARTLSSAAAALTFEGTTHCARFSIGAWMSPSESHLATVELVERAEEAKKRAKSLGKGRLVVRDEQGISYREHVLTLDAT